MTLTTTQQAYTEGYCAFGKKTDNPYPLHTSLYDAWLQGWADAREDEYGDRMSKRINQK